MKRRQFAKKGSLGLASLLLLKCKSENTMKAVEKATGNKVGDFGLQLWSVRDDMGKDPVGTLKTLAEIGYKDIESAGYSEGKFYGVAPKEFKKVLDDLGLKMRSGHAGTGITTPDAKGTMSNDWERYVNDHREIGIESAVCGYFHETERQTIDDYKRVSELFNRCGEKTNEYGISMLHHNHDFEFVPIDGQVPYDLMLAELDPKLANFELDFYWVKKGKADPFKLFSDHPGRFPVWHVKDMDDTPEQFFTEVGSGIIDYVSIFKKAKEAGLKYFYVEQDAFKSLEPLASVKQSHDYVKGMVY